MANWSSHLRQPPCQCVADSLLHCFIVREQTERCCSFRLSVCVWKQAKCAMYDGRMSSCQKCYIRWLGGTGIDIYRHERVSCSVVCGCADTAWDELGCWRLLDGVQGKTAVDVLGWRLTAAMASRQSVDDFLDSSELISNALMTTEVGMTGWQCRCISSSRSMNLSSAPCFGGFEGQRQCIGVVSWGMQEGITNNQFRHCNVLCALCALSKAMIGNEQGRIHAAS
eukprot:365914-Chlamydomonas_euryale.AAC.1